MRRSLVVTATTLLLGFSATLLAETSAHDAYEYRESIMTALKGHAGAISKQTRGLAGDPAHITGHANAIAALVAELKTVFQEGSGVEESEALPAIWAEPEEFAEALARVEEAAGILKVTAAGGDMAATGRAFANVGKACKGCHERFREEDED